MQLIDHCRTPADFASASDKVWGHFAAMGLRRTPRTTLLDLGIIKKVGVDPFKSGPIYAPQYLNDLAAFLTCYTSNLEVARNHLFDIFMSHCH